MLLPTIQIQLSSAINFLVFKYQRFISSKAHRDIRHCLQHLQVQMHEEKDSLTQMPVTVFTLQSIYAFSDDDKLLFQLNQGRMDMLVIVFLLDFLTIISDYFR
jgi:hypothetical protein